MQKQVGLDPALQIVVLGRGTHGSREPPLTGGARTEAIAELVVAGESRPRIAEIYGISVDDLNAAGATRAAMRLDRDPSPTYFVSLGDEPPPGT